MKIYYLTSTELGWDNVICLATTKQKLISAYTDGDINFETEEEVDKFIKENRTLHIGEKILNE